jgi:uncharacterized protein YndB with AHSA1/START domain
MTQTGHTKDAGWQIGVSRTLDHPVTEVWDFITSPEGVAIWLGEGTTVPREPGEIYETTIGVRGETRSFRELDRLRLTWRPADWTHDTILQLTVSSSGEGRARLGIHQDHLAGAGEREHQRTHWKAVIAAVAEKLG